MALVSVSQPFYSDERGRGVRGAAQVRAPRGGEGGFGFAVYHNTINALLKELFINFLLHFGWETLVLVYFVGLFWIFLTIKLF